MGKVKGISELPNEEHKYFFEIAIKTDETVKQLIYNKGNKIILRGEIIIDEPRLLSKFLSGIISF